MSMDSFFSGLNPFMAGLLRSPFHWPISIAMLLITVTGRKSGRKYTFPVGYQRVGDDLVILVSDAPKKMWWKNLRTPRPVEIHLRGRAFHGEAQVVDPRSAEFVEHVENTLRRVPGFARGLGIDFDRKGGLTEEQREKLSRDMAVVRVESIEAMNP